MAMATATVADTERRRGRPKKNQAADPVVPARPAPTNGALFDKKLPSAIHRKLEALASELADCNSQFAAASRQCQSIGQQLGELCREHKIATTYRVGDKIIKVRIVTERWIAKVVDATDDAD